MGSSQKIQDILDISRKAGELLKKLSLDPEMRKPRRKGDGSPVTEADLRVSDFLMEALAPLGLLVVSEEALPNTPPDPNQDYFLVDPLDGTKYFARGENEFALCVGLLRQGVPCFGAIYDPTTGQMFWAEKGKGAFCDDSPIAHKGVTGPLTVFSSGFHKRPEKDLIVSELNIGTILEKGSALKFCDIAKGDVDLYMRFGPTSEWDTAAAQVILEEAGCVLYEAHTLKPMAYGKANYLNRGTIACHSSQIERVIDFLKKHPRPKKKSTESAGPRDEGA